MAVGDGMSVEVEAGMGVKVGVEVGANVGGKFGAEVEMRTGVDAGFTGIMLKLLSLSLFVGLGKEDSGLVRANGPAMQRSAPLAS